MTLFMIQQVYDNTSEDAPVQSAQLKRTLNTPQSPQRSCLTAHPGISVRAIIIVVGSICFAFSFIGYFSAFYDNIPVSKSKNSNTYYIRGYGLGYEKEILNQVHFWCVAACYLFSISTFVIIIKYSNFSHRWKKMNRIMHLIFGALLFSTWVCGIVGTMYFTSNCCHISYGFPLNTTYNESPHQGYSDRCNCTLTVKWKSQHVVHQEINDTTTENWSSEIYNQSEIILKAMPHNLLGRVIFLGVDGVWVALYAVSFTFA